MKPLLTDSLSAKKPLSLYIHIPFCQSKCLYCDFVSLEGKVSEMGERYLESLAKEIDLFIADHPTLLAHRTIETIFIGGGTPTALTDEQFDRLLAILSNRFGVAFSATLEYTVEANPKTLSPGKIRSMIDRQVNRVSLGLQSSVSTELTALGRIHSFADATDTVAELRSYGLHNINLDLMYAIPGQTLTSFRQSLEDTVSLEPAHISAYSLILEEGTPLFRQYATGNLSLPSEEEDLAMSDLAVTFLEDRGYHRYEISNFAKNNQQCRHNMVYWNSGEYISFGLSAHSYLDGVRYANTSDMTIYLESLAKEKLPITQWEVITKQMAFEERIFLGLRMTQGLSISGLNQEFQMDFLSKYDLVLKRLEREGLIVCDRERLRLSCKGFELSNYVFREILTD